MRISRRAAAVLIGLAAIVAAGVWAASVAEHSEPTWVVWARTSADGSIEARESAPDGVRADGEWVSAGPEGGWGPGTAAIDEVAESRGWKVWANRLKLRRRWNTRWHRVPLDQPRPDGWAPYVTTSGRLTDGAVDPSLAGAWTLAQERVGSRGQQTFQCDDIELRPDGTIGGAGASGTWRVARGALGIEWHVATRRSNGMRNCVMAPVGPGRLYRTAASADELRRR